MLYETCCVYFLLFPTSALGFFQGYSTVNNGFLLDMSMPEWDEDMVFCVERTSFPSLALLLTLAPCLLLGKDIVALSESRDGVEHKSTITISRRSESCDS